MFSVGSALAIDSRYFVVELSPTVKNESSSGGDGGGMDNDNSAEALGGNPRFRL